MKNLKVKALSLLTALFLLAPSCFAWSDWNMHHYHSHPHYHYYGGSGYYNSNGFNNGFTGGLLGGILGGLIGGAIQRNNQPQYQPQPQQQPPQPQCVYVQDPYQPGLYHRVCQ